MAIDTCITNVGEYYSSHYLDSTFTKDVKELVKKWSEEGSQSAPRRLQSLSQHYFRAKTQALDEEEPIRRQFAGEEVRSWHAGLLQALGYTGLDRFDSPVEGGETFVPVVGRVRRPDVRLKLMVSSTVYGNRSGHPDTSGHDPDMAEGPRGTRRELPNPCTTTIYDMQPERQRGSPARIRT